MVRFIDLIPPKKRLEKRLRDHDDVKASERLTIGYADWLSDPC
ncbi:MAG TPA: hypothetical protein VNA15_04300 [Candidatus Angelobacter sp.]|nr:hypothetical protein [Candidatus Angelobacter sp.]